MGFDLYGIKAKSERGEYFRNNIWWWYPLWAYVCDVCGDILTEKDCSGGQFNNGYEINNSKAKKIAKKLFEALEENGGKKYEDALEAEKNYLKKRSEKLKTASDEEACFSKENIKEFAEFCRTSGGFTIH